MVLVFTRVVRCVRLARRPDHAEPEDLATVVPVLEHREPSGELTGRDLVAEHVRHRAEWRHRGGAAGHRVFDRADLEGRAADHAVGGAVDVEIFLAEVDLRLELNRGPGVEGHLARDRGVGVTPSVEVHRHQVVGAVDICGATGGKEAPDDRSVVLHTKAEPRLEHVRTNLARAEVLKEKPLQPRAGIDDATARATARDAERTEDEKGKGRE